MLITTLQYQLHFFSQLYLKIIFNTVFPNEIFPRVIVTQFFHTMLDAFEWLIAGDLVNDLAHFMRDIRSMYSICNYVSFAFPLTCFSMLINLRGNFHIKKRANSHTFLQSQRFFGKICRWKLEIISDSNNWTDPWFGRINCFWRE